MQTNDYTNKKSAMKHWKYSYDYNQTFINEWNSSFK